VPMICRRNGGGNRRDLPFRASTTGGSAGIAVLAHGERAISSSKIALKSEALPAAAVSGEPRVRGAVPGGRRRTDYPLRFVRKQDRA
jgi:hypothetical protein